ncbi:hypothetical protein [Bradyrhizobium sp.]|uniref:hypothetical protein n=1 Tax=Bradyrhizobium sp. TaxID=376 RepID=UPI0023979BA4|nr:hypothetical protein [Bradyrhizobium sp.]MDE2380563.1 hypothetical protein [Bradyrhizobium sp.]
MELRTGFGWARLPLLAAALLFAAAPEAPAQTVPAAQADDETEAAAVPDASDPDILGDIDVDKLDWSQLNTDADETLAAKTRAGKSASGNDGLNWSSNTRANGSSAVTVKQSVTPFWDTRIGADMTVAPEPTTMSELLAQKAANGGSLPQSSGSAWAAATAPGAGAIWDKTAVEARIDPGAESSKLGASLTKSLPLSGDYSLTLQNGYSVFQQGTAPIPGVAGRITRNYETDQTAKVTIGDTGTSLIAGQSLSTADDRWLRKLGAEQKLTDGVTISGSIGETAQGATSKSLTAGFKKSW